MKTIIFILFFLLTFEAATCTCTHEGKFTKISKETDLVFLGKVIGHGSKRLPGWGTSQTIRVQISDIWKGKYDKNIVELYGNPGSLCLETISKSKFALNNKYLFAINQPRGGTQGINTCGEYWMAVNGNYAIGTVMHGKMIKAYQEPIAKLRNQISKY